MKDVKILVKTIKKGEMYMAAGIPPKGAVIPEPKVVPTQKDEKPVENPSVQQSAAKEDLDIDESDLKEFQESKKVPYERFKEVNEKQKVLQQQIAELTRSKEADIRRAIEDAEIRISSKLQAQKQEDDSPLLSIDPAQKEINKLYSEIASLRDDLKSVKSESSVAKLEKQMDSLEARYPEADKLAVLGWKKNKPEADLEELMELSHRRNVDRLDGKLREIFDKKKAKKSLPSSNAVPRLTEDQKPKTLKEAAKLMRSFYGQ